MKKTFKEFVEQIEKENEEFLNLPKNKKKVRLAQDVLTRLKFDNIKPLQGEFYNSCYSSKSAKNILNNISSITCQCCAKGSLFLSYIGRVNNYTFTYNTSSSLLDETGEEHQKLLEIFTLEELDAIEIAFEGESFLYIIPEEEVDKVLTWRKKLKQGNTSKGSTKILKAICNNIIKNDGEFIY